MKILELHLLAFGPFTDLRLDFSSPSPGLHVVYGPNEAGKSTALRAIRGLLYGIPHITPDAHLHHNTDLRVGGRLAGRGDAALALVRRKGRVKTLRDPDDNPLDDAALAPVLGGVTEELFRTSFGLTHETLRQGAEALLQGKGDVGQSLFGAGLGGPGLQQLLTTLRQEADEIFTPQARTRPLNEAIKAFEAARNGARSAAHPPADWTRKRQEIDEQRAEQERVDAELRALRSTDKRLRRALRVLPLLEARRAILGRRAALGHVVLLPESAQRDREDAQDRAADASAQASRLRADIAELEARHAALEVPASLADLDAGAIDGLVTRLGSHRKAAVDLPRVRAELHGVEEDARAILRRLGRDASLAGGDDPERLEAMRVDVATEARIKKLARERGAAEAKPREVERLLSAHRARRDACARRLAELPSGEDPAPLRGALSRAQKQGDLEHRLREAAAAAAQLARDADAQRDRLGLGAAGLRTRLDVGEAAARQARLDVGEAAARQARLDVGEAAARQARLDAGDAPEGRPLSAAEASALPVPLPETVDRAAAQWGALARERERLGERAAEIEARLRESAREIDALQRAGAVPTEADLAEARERRDAAFKALVRALQAKAGARAAAATIHTATLFDIGADAPASPGARRRPSLAARDEPPAARGKPDDYADLVRAADALADRLRREADRVARLARLLADEARAQADQAQLATERAALARRAEEAEAAWIELWRPAGVAPRSPEEMRGWLGRYAVLTATVDRLRAAEAEAEALRARMQAHAAELHAAIQGARAAPGASRGDAAGVGSRRDAASVGARGDAAGAPEDAPARLPALVEAAEQELAAIEGAARERKELLRERKELEREIEDLEREQSQHARALEAWRAEWAEGVRPLGLPGDASADEATAILDELGVLFRKADSAAHERRRVRGMERDARAFAADVAELASRHAPDLAPLPADQAADQLIKRHHKARADLRERGEIARSLADKRRELDQQEARRAAAESRLAKLFEAAGVPRGGDDAADVAALSLAEERSREARRLDRELVENEGKLLEAGEGAGIAALEQETAEVERDALALELDRAEERLAALEDERRRIDRALGSLEQEREHLRATVGAAEAAAEAQICLSHLRGEVRRYVRARLAAVLLEREIERYRERNQGPILARASALFHRLTLGAFAGLRVGYDESEQAILRCVRAAASSAGVGGAAIARAPAPDGAAEPVTTPADAAAEPAKAPTDAPAEPAKASVDAAAEPAKAPTDAAAKPATAPTDAAAEPARAPVQREVDVTGLSDGTRDQLYLALRLASLEHHARTGEPMPLILDDILIHFDDDRARAALAVLGELAGTTQVLFFTHHARLCELAREAVPADVLREHRLR
ncbi:AAA family ATPase [Sorangium atrum]|uniref:AAA family ATPase n=1 Tax=Sorangium atrum TaxID=2995308 RepID=A0ABT5CI85_9BACT|nr:AAA family ATPase [Sorangium aterium]MDC0685540.1 AAA family ATPase [Sorangium aterium]